MTKFREFIKKFKEFFKKFKEFFKRIYYYALLIQILLAVYLRMYLTYLYSIWVEWKVKFSLFFLKFFTKK
jgi:hypothetical protein